MMEKKIRVMLVEDHKIVREGLKALLGGNEALELAGEASSGRDAVRNAAALRPDVIVMDILLPELNGIDATRQIVKNYPGTRVVILSMRERELLQLIAEGKTSAEAAGILNLSVKTVEGHRTNIMSKLDIHNVAGLIRYAIKKGLVSDR
jgi:DNA-binding NarL/FixJ family response regulator